MGGQRKSKINPGKQTKLSANIRKKIIFYVILGKLKLNQLLIIRANFATLKSTFQHLNVVPIHSVSY